MLKNCFILLILVPWFALSASKECSIKPDYDILITQKQVEITRGQHQLIIYPDGKIRWDDQDQKITSNQRKDAQRFESSLRRELPSFHSKAKQNLDELKTVFDKSIQTKLRDDNYLHKQLDKLYNTFNKLIDGVLSIDNQTLQFNHQRYNTLRPDAEIAVKKSFYQLIEKSLLKFDVFKNYRGIQKIAKEEWKGQKSKLKKIDIEVCSLVTNIDAQYKQIITTFD